MEAPAPRVPARAQSSHAAEPERREPPTPAPAYTGGIFNLNAPADRPSRNLDYLLEDDEPRSHKGLVIGIVALALVAGLGYLRWRNGGLPFLNLAKLASKTPTQTAEPAPTPAPAEQTPAPAESTAPPNSEPAPPANNPAITLAPAPGAPASNAATPSPAPAEHPATESKAADAPAQTTAPTDEATTPAAAAADQPAPSQPGGSPAPSAIPPAEAASPAPRAAKPKPSPKASSATKPEDTVAMGERYLYGRGVPQDCSRGLRYVKPAADQANPKAMITMGALYATGHCLSRDLPTAYRFFALALRKDPENGPLKQNAQMVWAQMTDAERQQAIRMTQ